MTPLRAVDRVVNVAPQVQVTVVSLYSGWIPVFTEQLPMIDGRRVVRAGCATGTGARAPVCQTVNHPPDAVIPAPPCPSRLAAGLSTCPPQLSAPPALSRL